MNFAVAELGDPVNIPIGLNVSAGNTPDGRQFIDLLESILPLLNEESMMVMAAAGDNKDVIDGIFGKGLGHVVRKRMNVTDDKRIAEFHDSSILVDPIQRVWFRKRAFLSSGRTTYLFFSEKLYDDKVKALDSCAHLSLELKKLKSMGRGGSIIVYTPQS